MVARINLNTGVAARLKRLQDNVEKSSTTPNGINVLEDGSAIEIYDPNTGALAVRLSPTGSLFTGQVTIQAGSTIPTSAVDGLDAALSGSSQTTTTLNSLTTTEGGSTVIDGAKILTGSIAATSIKTTELDARYARLDELTTGVLNVTGRFSTDMAGYPSLVIQPSQTSWNGKDLAIWWTADGSTPGFGNTAGTVAGLWMTSTPTLTSQHPLNIRGQSNAGVIVWGSSLVVRASSGSLASLTGYSGQNFDIRSYADSMYSATGSLLVTANQVRLNSTGAGMPVRIESDVALAGKIYGADGVAPLMSARGMTFDPVEGFIPLIYSGNTMRVESGTYLDIKGKSGARVMTDVNVFRLTDYGSGYRFTTSSAANVYQDSANGAIYRVSSGTKYKKNVTEHALNEAYLSLPTFEWTDRMADEEFVKRGLDKSKKPSDPNDLAVWRMAQRRIVGTLAEQAAKVVPELVVLDTDGLPDAYEYERDGSMLRPFVRILWDDNKAMKIQIADLIKRIETLEGKKPTAQ